MSATEKHHEDWDVRFWRDESGIEPVRKFLISLGGRDEPKKLAATTAIERILRAQGTDVCSSEWGKNLGGGLYEFRIRHTADEIERRFAATDDVGSASRLGPRSSILIRIFFTTAGRRIILLLTGYDKGTSPSSRREQVEIKKARRLVARARASSVDALD